MDKLVFLGYLNVFFLVNGHKDIKKTKQALRTLSKLEHLHVKQLAKRRL